MLQLAKQGDPKAIASLINRQLQPRGITTKASLKDGCLQIMLESASVPKQQVMVTGLRKLIASFDVESIQKVKVYGKQIGEEFPDWNEEFEIDRKTTSTSIAASEAISQVSPLPVPEPSATEVNIPSSELNIDPALKELAKQGDVKAISSLISNQLQRNDLVVRASLRNGLLQVVLVSSNVPSQQTTVPIIQDLLTVVESSLINKVKINGLQELSGATNSKLLWSEEFELEVIEIQSEISTQVDVILPSAKEKKNLLSKFRDSNILNKFTRLLDTNFDKAITFIPNNKFKSLVSSNKRLSQVSLASLCLVSTYFLFFTSSPEKVVDGYLNALKNGDEKSVKNYSCDSKSSYFLDSVRSVRNWQKLNNSDSEGKKDLSSVATNIGFKYPKAEERFKTLSRNLEFKYKKIVYRVDGSNDSGMQITKDITFAVSRTDDSIKYHKLLNEAYEYELYSNTISPSYAYCIE